MESIVYGTYFSDSFLRVDAIEYCISVLHFYFLCILSIFLFFCCLFVFLLILVVGGLFYEFQLTPSVESGKGLDAHFFWDRLIPVTPTPYYCVEANSSCHGSLPLP